MLFFEFDFLFLFLPVVLGVYALLGTRAQNTWLFLASLVFYAFSSLAFLPFLVLSVLVDYVVGGRLSRSEDPRRRKQLLLVSLVVNLGLLGWFKYAGFFSGALAAVFGDAVPLLETVLPVGISFYTFQSMSYTIDLYRGEVRPADRLRDFGAYVCMFPQLIAGPIVRYAQLEQQLRERRFDEARAASGVVLIAAGLAKKLVVADTLASVSAPLFAQEQVGFLPAWTAMVLYSGQIYFDFSGYSDIAIGLGRLLGFEFPANFNSPYKATSFADFWRRWHITLSTWLRDYLYIPLGGNRQGTLRTYRNLFVTMLLGGLWHGASWNFVLWGAAHGTLLASERALGGRNPLLRLPPWPRRVLIFVAVTVVWVPFKLETPGEVATWLQAMLGAGGLGQLPGAAWAALLATLALVWLPPNTNEWREPVRGKLAPALLLFALALVVGYGRLEPSPFLYFRF